MAPRWLVVFFRGFALYRASALVSLAGKWVFSGAAAARLALVRGQDPSWRAVPRLHEHMHMVVATSSAVDALRWL